MIKVFEIILCMYLKSISPDVPRCGRSLHLYVLNIKNNIGQAILFGKCCHCRIKLVRPHLLSFSEVPVPTQESDVIFSYISVLRVSILLLDF